VRVRVRATGEGEARLLASVSAGIAGSDAIDHRIEVAPQGRHVSLGRARWLTREETIPLMKGDVTRTLEGSPELVLEASLDDALTGVLPSLEPDRIGSAEDAADAASAFERLSRAFAANHPNEAARAKRKQTQALGRFAALTQHGGVGDAMQDGLLRRARSLATTPDTTSIVALAANAGDCPKETASGMHDELTAIESEPPPTAGGVLPCWEATASNAMHDAGESPNELARLVLAFADRPHRKKLALAAADTLASRVWLSPSGEITLGLADTRWARAMVYAAFVRATSIGWEHKARPEALLGWLLVQRAADGGFGSVRATRAAVDALSGYPSPTTPMTVHVESLDKDGGRIGKIVSVALTKTSRVSLDPHAVSVRVSLEQAPTSNVRGVLARIEQNALLRFRDTLSAEDLASPIAAELKWPDKPVVDRTATLEVRFTDRAGGPSDLVTRIPLPPGASLAEEVTGVLPLEGALLVNRDKRPVGLPIEIPLRFGVAGEFMIPDTVVRATADPELKGLVPATRFSVAEK